MAAASKIALKMQKDFCLGAFATIICLLLLPINISNIQKLGQHFL